MEKTWQGVASARKKGSDVEFTLEGPFYQKSFVVDQDHPVTAVHWSNCLDGGDRISLDHGHGRGHRILAHDILDPYLYRVHVPYLHLDGSHLHSTRCLR